MIDTSHKEYGRINLDEVVMTIQNAPDAVMSREDCIKHMKQLAEFVAVRNYEENLQLKNDARHVSSFFAIGQRADKNLKIERILSEHIYMATTRENTDYSDLFYSFVLYGRAYTEEAYLVASDGSNKHITDYLKSESLNKYDIYDLKRKSGDVATRFVNSCSPLAPDTSPSTSPSTSPDTTPITTPITTPRVYGG